MNKEKLYFITDLDRTIIHSKNKGFRCVEVMGKKEITYMTDLAYEKLQDILKEENLVFVPCTMRNIKQTLRVDFIREYNPKIIICTNGAEIYIDGELDKEWDKKIKKIVNHTELIKNIEYLKDIAEKNKEIEVLEVRNIEDFYITVKCKNEDFAKKFYALIKDSFKKELLVINIEAKIFIIDENIDKIHAVQYLEEKLNIKNLITSGDSVVDEKFTTRGSCILPKHSSFKHKEAIITDKNKIESTEEILDFVKNKLSYI